MRTQVGLRKHHYKQSYWMWWKLNWAISNSKRWCCETAALNMPANVENSAVATGLEKGSFHSSPYEWQCQRIFTLPYNYTHLTCQQSNAQNSPSQTSTVCEPWASRCSSWILEKAEEQEIKLSTSGGSSQKQESSRKTSTSALFTTTKPLTVWITTNCGKFFRRWAYQTTLPAFWEICMQVKKQQYWTWNNELVPNWERSTSRLYIVTLRI